MNDPEDSIGMNAVDFETAPIALNVSKPDLDLRTRVALALGWRLVRSSQPGRMDYAHAVSPDGEGLAWRVVDEAKLGHCWYEWEQSLDIATRHIVPDLLRRGFRVEILYRPPEAVTGGANCWIEVYKPSRPCRWGREASRGTEARVLCDVFLAAVEAANREQS